MEFLPLLAFCVGVSPLLHQEKVQLVHQGEQSARKLAVLTNISS